MNKSKQIPVKKVLFSPSTSVCLSISPISSFNCSNLKATMPTCRQYRIFLARSYETFPGQVTGFGRFATITNPVVGPLVPIHYNKSAGDATSNFFDDLKI